MSTPERSTGAKRERRSLPVHIPIPWVFVLVYLAGVVLESVAPLHERGRVVSGLSVVGAVLFGLGAVLAGLGLMTFRRARTTTVPGKDSSQLVTWGPYRFTRNPMYVGLTVAYLGEAGILQQLWPVVFLPLVLAYVQWIVIPVEEERLHDVFGDRYELYRASVRRWL